MSMNISAGMVKDLREQTGVGMMECKKALTESGGDLQKAIVWLREHGMARANKKSGRVTAEGIVEVALSADNKSGVLVEVNCETDFVSKNDDFQGFVKEVATVALKAKTASVEELKNAKLASGTSVGETLSLLIAKIGENLNLRRVEVLQASSNGVVAGYSHMGGKIGAMVCLEGTTSIECAKDVAMHIAAANPKYLDPSSTNQDELAQEKEIARKKLVEEGRPADMLEKILAGHVNKFYKEICLTEQPFVKDSKQSVSAFVKSVAKDASIKGFIRFQLGDGIEKKSDDFAAEVAKLTGQ